MQKMAAFSKGAAFFLDLMGRRNKKPGRDRSQPGFDERK